MTKQCQRRGKVEKKVDKAMPEKKQELDAIKTDNVSRDQLLAKLKARLDVCARLSKAGADSDLSDSDEPVAPLPKTAEPRRPKTFSGEGAQDQAGEVRRFANQMSLYFDLADIPAKDQVAHARLYLEGAAADYMHTAMQTMPASDRTDCWDQLRDLKQGTMTAAQYVHKVQYCFNGFIELPSSDGEKIERFMAGLNPVLRKLVVTAPVGMGRNGKWIDPAKLMSYATMQAQALVGGGGAFTSGAGASTLGSPSSSAGPSTGQKRAHDGQGKGNGGNGRKQKGKGKGKQSGIGQGGRPAFCTAAEKAWLAKSKLCFHCTKRVHAFFDCEAKKDNQQVAPMPQAFAKASKALSSTSLVVLVLDMLWWLLMSLFYSLLILLLLLMLAVTCCCSKFKPYQKLLIMTSPVWCCQTLILVLCLTQRF